jgi:hypothetical protein
MVDDFPAAHSMDTYWFAIDKDGHVGCFSSGEAGAVPTEAFAAEHDAYRRMAAVLPRGEHAEDLQGRALPGRSAGRHHLPARDLDFPVLLFLPSLETVQTLLADGRATALGATQGNAVLVRGLTPAEFRQLHDDGLCQGCFMYFEADYPEGPSASAADYGMYFFDHLTENWISGPYGRQKVPGRPVHVDELPPDLRRRVKQVRFEGLSFRDTPHIQPVEVAPCESWESAYLDGSGRRIRAMPGKEDEYADMYDELSDDNEFEVEPPPGGAGHSEE